MATDPSVSRADNSAKEAAAGFLWWELSTEQKLNRMAWTGPLALVALGFYLIVVRHLALGLAIELLAGTAFVNIGLAVLFVWRLREERAAKSRAGSESVLSPVEQGDGRSGFAALGFACASVGALGGGLAFAQTGTLADAELGAVAIGVAVVAGVLVLPALFLIGRTLFKRSSTPAARAAAAAAGALLACGLWLAYAQIHAVIVEREVRNIVAARGAPVFDAPGEWTKTPLPGPPFTVGVAFVNAARTIEVDAFRVGFLAADADEARCLYVLDGLREGSLQESNFKSFGALKPSALRTSDKELCRATFVAEGPNGAHLDGVMGAVSCPTRGGAVLCRALATGGPPVIDAASHLGCIDDPPRPIP